jgi:hypothetical protein
MPTKKTSSAPVECIAAYDKLVASFPEIERKGATMPYTSINGHMTSYLNSDGRMALKLPPDAREAFLAKYDAKLFEAYGIVQKEFVTVPPSLLANTEELAPYFVRSAFYEKLSSDWILPKRFYAPPRSQQPQISWYGRHMAHRRLRRSRCCEQAEVSRE